MTAAGHEFRGCPRCRAELVKRPEGGLERTVCPACGFVQYLNPEPGAGGVLLSGREVCLVRRRFAPRAGYWSLPTGFMEWEESAAETAVREAREETGLDVRLIGLYAVETGILPPDRPVLVVFYRAEETGGDLVAGDDADAVGFFPPQVPPGPVAFAAHRRVLSRLATEQEAQRKDGS